MKQLSISREPLRHDKDRLTDASATIYFCQTSKHGLAIIRRNLRAIITAGTAWLPVIEAGANRGRAAAAKESQ